MINEPVAQALLASFVITVIPIILGGVVGTYCRRKGFGLLQTLILAACCWTLYFPLAVFMRLLIYGE